MQMTTLFVAFLSLFHGGERRLALFALLPKVQLVRGEDLVCGV